MHSKAVLKRLTWPDTSRLFYEYKSPSYKQNSNSYFSYHLASTEDTHIIIFLLPEKVVEVEHSEMMNECCTLAALCSVILLFSLAACLFFQPLLILQQHCTTVSFCMHVKPYANTHTRDETGSRSVSAVWPCLQNMTACYTCRWDCI